MRRAGMTVGALALALFAALYSTALAQEGRYRLSAVIAALALGLGGVVALKIAPGLARKSLPEGWKVRFEYELTREGICYFVIIGIIAVASVNTGNNLLFIILAILLAGILVSGILSKIVLSGLHLEVDLPEHIFAGEPVRAHMTLRNSKRVIPSYSLTVGQNKTAKPAARRGATKPRPQEIFATPVYVPYIPAGGSVKEVVELRFPRRGRYRQNGFQVSSKFPFSILRRKRTLPATHEILVLPGIDPTPGFRTISPLIRGKIESLRKGRGCDLYALRGYQAGDSARQVDWKATAKTQKLMVREFTREEENCVTILLDACLGDLSVKARERFERAISLCACLAWQAYSNGSLLQFIGGSLKTPMEPAAGIIYPVLEELAVLQPVPRDGSNPGMSRQWEELSIEGELVLITERAEPFHASIPAARIIAIDGM